MTSFDLGTHSMAITTVSSDAQYWFDQGLNWRFGFNKEESVKCFQKALNYDPSCAMAHWGVAYGVGPFYNLTWSEYGEQEANTCTKIAYDHLVQARATPQRLKPLELELIAALSARYQKPHAVSVQEFARWENHYAAAMRRVFYSFPNNHDVMALFAEALLMRTPRRLWDLKTGLPAPDSDIREALSICERSIAIGKSRGLDPHPAIPHLHIHALEMSAEPERAMSSADMLSTLCPDSGHMNHMPGHIYVLCGQYERAKAASEVAIRANDKFLNYAGPFTFYTVACCHDLHLMMHTCMLMGRYSESISAANKMCSLLSREVLSVRERPKFAMTLEGYFSMKLHVLVRFGKWREIIDDPLPSDPDLYLVTTAMHHYAKGIAHASLKNFDDADLERKHFYDSLERIPPERRFFNNWARDILAVGTMMLEGEVEYHKGHHDIAFKYLRESVVRDDNLEYIEPWAWMHPPRHALAALLMEQGSYTEAEEIYRDDLGLTSNIQRCAQHPNNVWSLHGLVECLRWRNDRAELEVFEPALARALQNADVPIASSCMCRTKVNSTLSTSSSTPDCCA
jgi:tetratricopeptide (TPR) repeat protein